MPATITSMPPEIFERIILSLDPQDPRDITIIAAIAQVCRVFRTFIYYSPDSHLWRSLYLQQPLDDPRTPVNPLGVPRTSPVDWGAELRRITRASRIVTQPEKYMHSTERHDALRTLLDLACHVPSASTPSANPSANLMWLALILRKNTVLLERTEGVHEEEEGEEMQLCAQLHTYFGITARDVTRMRRAEARGYVYALRNYQYANDFGPFLADGSGRVNWVHMQALHHVVSMHLLSLSEDEDYEFVVFPMSLPFCQSVVPEGLDLDVESDWAGIEGLWHCAFAFIDHRDLLSESSL
jgi:hypothetical protein